MADTFELELVSPESLLLSEPVEMVVVPGVDGDVFRAVSLRGWPSLGLCEEVICPLG